MQSCVPGVGAKQLSKQLVRRPNVVGYLDRRYWNVDLWQKLFTTLLNPPSNDSDVAALQSLRASFRVYMCSNRQLVGKLNQMLAKQKASLCSS